MDNLYDKQKIISYMKSYHCGYANSTARINISRALGMPDRYFRDLCSEIPEIITSSTGGYHILPKSDPTGKEKAIAEEIIKEHRKRAIALFLRQKRQRKAIAEMESKTEQLVLF